MGTTLVSGGRALFFLATLALMVWWAGPIFAVPAPPPQQKTGSKTSATKSTTKNPTQKRRTTRRRARGQMTPTADRIKEIQSALAREGHYTSEPTGKWDSATVEALKRFQASQELKATGKLDARTLQALGFGSQVAGMAPPREPASGSSSQ